MNRVSNLILNLTTKQLMVFAIVAGFILYGNTLGHNYALDDAIVITKNEFTKQGINGISDILFYDSFTGFFGKEKQLVDGGRYRPLSIITFAIEYQLFGESPFVSHLLNIIIYSLIAILIYLLVLQLLSEKFGVEKAKWMALITTVLFLIHPIHTEVVANIKGRDELLSLLFSLLAFQAVIKFYDSKKNYLLFASGVFLFLGLMSKENAIAFVVIIPLALIYFREYKIKKLIIGILPLVISTFIFLIIRYNVLGGFQQNVANELMNNPFVYATENQKYSTIIYTWVIYLKLLVFPHPLTYDYYPYHISLLEFSSLTVIISLTLVLLLFSIAIVGLRRKSLISFTLLGFAASFSMVSNIVFPVGTFMNERFIFIPSLFFCLALSHLAIVLFQKDRRWIRILLILVFGYVVVFFPLKTIARNRAWKNDLTLFTTDVKTSSESAKSNCSAGGKLWEEGKTTIDAKTKEEYFVQSERYLRKSIQIHPDYDDAWLLLGNILFDAKKDINGSALCFLEVLKRQPGNINAWQNADIVLQQTDNRELQLEYYAQLYVLDSNNYTMNYRLGVLHGRYFGDLSKGIYYLKRATIINPNKADAFKDLGTAFGIMGFEKEAYQTCKKALELDKNDAQIYINLGIASSKLGLIEESQMYFKQAEQLKLKQ